MALYKKHSFKGDDTQYVYKRNTYLDESGNEKEVLSQIPLFDLNNTDTREYLEWVEAGNTPEAAD